MYRFKQYIFTQINFELIEKMYSDESFIEEYVHIYKTIIGNYFFFNDAFIFLFFLSVLNTQISRSRNWTLFNSSLSINASRSSTNYHWTKCMSIISPGWATLFSCSSVYYENKIRATKIYFYTFYHSYPFYISIFFSS